MTSRAFESGIKALQDLLPPLEDCPNCGSETVKPRVAIEGKPALGLATLLLAAIVTFALTRRCR